MARDAAVETTSPGPTATTTAAAPAPAPAPVDATDDAPATVAAPTVIFVNGVRAFNEGDAVPAETARRLNLAGYKPGSGPIQASADANGIIDGG